MDDIYKNFGTTLKHRNRSIMGKIITVVLLNTGKTAGCFYKNEISLVTIKFKT
jgi:hypothetical protein